MILLSHQIMVWLNVLAFLDSAISYLENHSAVLGIVVAFFGALLIPRKIIREKRAEAFCSFYAQLLFNVSNLKRLLESNGDLGRKNSTGNIFCIYYNKELAQKYGYENNGQDERYAPIAETIKKLLLDSDSNVYPSYSEKTNWYYAQQIVFDFCIFIEQKKERERTDNPLTENGDPYHVRREKELNWALDFIKKSIYASKL